MLLDSNIIIYSADPAYSFLRKLIADKSPYVSVISKIEVLGYHKLQEKDRKLFSVFFADAPLIVLSDNIANKAIELRQKRNLSLGDSIIAATALEYDLTLVTRNTTDFTGVENLKLLNPFEK